MHSLQFVQYAPGGSAIYTDCNTGRADSTQGRHHILISIVFRPSNDGCSPFTIHCRLFPSLYSMCSPLHICCILNFFSTVQPRPTLPERHVQSGSGFYIADKTYSQKRRGLMNCRCCNNWVILQDSTLSKPQY